MSLSPIIIFAFNRLESLKACITSLLVNVEAKDSDLFVYVDGPRPNKSGEFEKVKEVQEYVKKIEGFKTLNCHFATTNKGLAASVISGVTEVINQYGKAIVVEDDLVVGKNFLSFMNQGLEKYENNKKVFSVCGYSNAVKVPKNYTYDSYFCTRSSSWGWATWKDRWNSVDWKLDDWNKVKKYASQFNQWGGSDCFKMLNDWKNGRNQSWAIRFCYSQFIQDKLSVFPTISKVKNDGFDGKGTNCKGYSRFKSLFDNTGNKQFAWTDSIEINHYIYKQILHYSAISMRLYSRLMYLLTK